MNPKTSHKINYKAAQDLNAIEDNSIDLVVTSPPYPMIEMWDEIMSDQDPMIEKAFEEGDGPEAFELMHQQLDHVWKESARVVKDGGFVCINIGDATRTIGKEFRLYPNHARIISAFLELGFSNLPNILWRKQTNAPNKFMGSGMLPAGAYVTLEHEWILIFRKGRKRAFKSEEEKQHRRNSSYFWEERNKWFSDLWDLKGTTQKIKKSESRKRSGAFPFEVPYRLINMYSVKGDMILDPFLGTGTTTLAAIASGRNSIGYEIDQAFSSIINKHILNSPEILNKYIKKRIQKHNKFVQERMDDPSKKAFKYINDSLGMPVITKQEAELEFSFVKNLEKEKNGFIVNYIPIKNLNDPIPFTKTQSDKRTLFSTAIDE